MRRHRAPVVRRRRPRTAPRAHVTRFFEPLELRQLLNGPEPPAFGDIPTIRSGEGGGVAWYDIPVTDPDTPASALTCTIDTASPPSYNAWFSGTRFYYIPGDGPRQQTFNIRVTDNTGLSDTASFVLDISDGPPSVTVTTPAPQVTGAPVTLSATAGDYHDDTLTARWIFGDGTASLPVALTGGTHTPGAMIWYPVVTQHTYERPGTYTATLIVTDEDGVAATSYAYVNVVRYLVDGGALTVGGTPANDFIHVSPGPNGKTNLFLDGAYQGAFPVTSVRAAGYLGDDTLDAAPDLALPVFFEGEAGSDLLRGGRADDLLVGEVLAGSMVGAPGNDRIEGRPGNDILVGHTGNDRLRGSEGRDLCLGGDGADSLFGDADDDILVAGGTSWDLSRDALTAIRDEWASARPYPTRVANIRNGSGSGDRANGPFFLGPTTTFDDNGAEDWLSGVGATDWFFANPTRNDKVTDRAGDEQLDPVF